MQSDALWKRYKKHLTKVASCGITLDISRMPFEERYWSQMEEPIGKAYDAMEALENGAIANPDENRMVGHYWLRDPELAPDPEITRTITDTVEDVQQFVRQVHSRQITPPKAKRFTDVLSIGIGGSALGPQLIADALGAKRDKLKLSFLDNTDTDGIQRTLDSLGARLKSTLVLVISKSGSTPEPRNAMIETRARFEANGLEFPKHAVAITGQGSQLDRLAQSEGWLKRFPMWDWVGGRTSVLATVGLVPLGLQGVDIQGLLRGAREMDIATRSRQTKRNPAARLALMWHLATNGKGEKDMVILPYKDRLLLMSRYLQQLIMESLGKHQDLDGNVVEQGIAVYGNKGSTDQHAFVQQLREGVNNFFATFITVLQDMPRPGQHDEIDVDPDRPGTITSGDFLNGFWQGTRQALYEMGRGSMTITLDKLDARSLGGLIALFERAVGFYATLVNINAYHQPGVEAGKKAAASILDLQQNVMSFFADHPDQLLGAEGVAEMIGEPDRVEQIHHILEHLAANKRVVSRTRRAYQAL